MGKKSKPPAPPDYTAAAEAQARSSQQAATQQTFANRPTINSPYGTQSWEQSTNKDPATGQDVTNWTQNTTLDPRLQGALDSQLSMQSGRSGLANDMLGQVRDSLGNPLDYSGMPQVRGMPAGATGSRQMQTGLDLERLGAMPGNAGDTRQRAEDALYQRQTRRLDPQFQREGAALETQLANQGLSRGTEAWNNAQSEHGNRKEDAYSRAMMESIIGGGVEAQRDFGMGMDRRRQGYIEQLGAGNFANSSVTGQSNLDNQQFQQGISLSDATGRQRQQSIAEEMQQRGQPLNELSALMHGQQVGMPQMPNFQGANTGQPVNYMGAATNQRQADLDRYNASQAQWASAMNGIFGLGRGAMSLYGL